MKVLWLEEKDWGKLRNCRRGTDGGCPTLNGPNFNRPVQVTASVALALEADPEMAAPALDGLHHAPGPEDRALKSANGSLAVGGWSR